jgi:hypothetical protein
MGAMQYGSATFRKWLRQSAMPLLFVGTSACVRPAADTHPIGSWAYEVSAPARGSRTVVVEATFEGVRSERLAIAPESTAFVHDLEVWTGAGYRPVARHGKQWVEPSCARRCKVRYRVELGALAEACGDEVDCARRVGDSTLSPALAWLVHPTPKTDVPVTVRVKTPNAIEFLTGMASSDDGVSHSYAFRSYDLDEGSFTAFGPMRRYRVDVTGSGGPGTARIDLSIVGTTKYAMPDTAIKAWVEDAATAVTALFGRFPVDRAALFVVPAKGESDVVFGKVLSLAGASVVLVVGDQMPASARRQDWVLVHELFHLGFPTFRGEGRWLGEGLATYYEPILRARAGWTTESDVFRQFARNMPRGVPQRGSAALAQRDDLDSIYWGGALFCLAADVKIREETRGKRSLDDVLRAALAQGGDATKVWTVAEVVRVGDRATGTKVLSSMYDRYAARGERIDFDGLLASLGVDRADERSVDLDDARPLAWVRRGIVGTRSATTVGLGPGAPKTLAP